MRRLPARCWLPQVLAGVLVFPPAMAAQQPGQVQSPPNASSATIQNLRVLALAGNGETNDLQHKVMAPLVVQVLDQNSRPIEGADVTFRFPPAGPSASFPNQQLSKTVKTDAQGQAAATGWLANNQVGPFQVHVTAVLGNQSGESNISMTNATRVVESNTGRRKSWWSHRWAKVAVIGGGAALITGIILLTRGSSTTTVAIAPGSPTVGAPH